MGTEARNGKYDFNYEWYFMPVDAFPMKKALAGTADDK